MAGDTASPVVLKSNPSAPRMKIMGWSFSTANLSKDNTNLVVSVNRLNVNGTSPTTLTANPIDSNAPAFPYTINSYSNLSTSPTLISKIDSHQVEPAQLLSINYEYGEEPIVSYSNYVGFRVTNNDTISNASYILTVVIAK